MLKILYSPFLASDTRRIRTITDAPNAQHHGPSAVLANPNAGATPQPLVAGMMLGSCQIVAHVRSLPRLGPLVEVMDGSDPHGTQDPDSDDAEVIGLAAVRGLLDFYDRLLAHEDPPITEVGSAVARI